MKHCHKKDKDIFVHYSSIRTDEYKTLKENDIVNFEVVEIEENPITWAKLKKDNCTIMLENYNEVCKEIKNYPKKVKTSNLIKFKYSIKQIVQDLYNNVINDNIEIFMELKETKYGSIEFGVIDPDGNMIIVSGNI